MWCLGTEFSGGLGSPGITVGLRDLKGLFKKKIKSIILTYDSKSLTYRTAAL